MATMNMLIKSKPKVMPECITTIQRSIPIRTVFDKHNLIESYENCYTRTYELTNLNYQTASEDEQVLTISKWRSFLNSVGSNMELNLSLFNRSINLEQFRESIMLKEVGDEFDFLRRQMNEVLMQRIMEGKNGLSRNIYLTLGVHTDNVKKASEIFKRLDQDTDKHLKTLGSSARALAITDKLEILHDIYNIDHQNEFLSKTRVLNSSGVLEEVSAFDFNNIREMGLSIQDIIAPSSLEINSDYIKMGKQYVRALRITEFPATMADTFLTDITNMNFTMLTNVSVKPLSNAETSALVNRQLVFIREEKNNQIKSNRKNGISEEDINLDLLERENEVVKLKEDISKNDEHLFNVTVTMLIFAENESKLQEYTDTVISECKKVSATCETLKDEQEEGLVTTLPLCTNILKNPRTLKSSSLAIMIPFSNLEVIERDGINYTLNAVSKNLIIYNRENKANYNGFVLGSSGSGKSFTCKTEIVNLFLSKPCDIIIIDPEQEYTYCVQKLNGQVIPIMPGGRFHLNPLDISTNYEFDGDSADPILEKVSFMMKLFESMLSKSWGMDSIQKTLIDECLRSLYAPFMKDGRLYRAPKKDETPTLNDMMQWFATCPQPEARELYFTLKRYAGDGSLNIFSKTTNVEMSNRIVSFDISAVGDELKLMAMIIIQDHIWSRLVNNRRRGRYTYFYCDEIHLFFQNGNEASAEFLSSLFKRSRKYNGACTGITQSVADMIEHPIAKKLLSECNFIQILNQQSEEARESLKATLNLSESSLDYITSAPIGQGLLYTGAQTVPFFSRFPKNNDIYPLLTSNANEILEYTTKNERRVRNA